MTITEIKTEIAKANLTEEDIDQLWDLLKDKSRDLRAKARLVAKASLTVGTEVVTEGLRPKALNGLRGKIAKIGNSRLDITLDKEPDSWSPAKKYVIGKTLLGVPLTAVRTV